MKTGQEIENDVYLRLRDSSLVGEVSGDVCLFGTRPKDSDKEDVVVKFVSGLSHQLQTGVVVVNIYVPDIYDLERDDSVKNITRCREIETAAQKWVAGLSGAEYLFSLARTIATFEEADIKQHFVSVRLKFQRWGFD